MRETRSQREPSFVSKEEGAPKPKALRHGGGCEYSLGRAREAGLGKGLPVALQWNALILIWTLKNGTPESRKT